MNAPTNLDSRARRRVLIGCVIAALTAAGCSIDRGDLAPDWTLNDLSGREHHLSDYKGRVVVLDFWATWCRPCTKVSPHMQMLHEKYADAGVAVLAVHYDSRGEPDLYVDRHGYTYTVLDDGIAMARSYGVWRIPTIMIIGPDSRVAHRQTGFRDGDEKQLMGVIDALLAARTGSP